MKIAMSPGAIIEALREHELAIAGLYEAYAEVFPECEDLWAGLAMEELQHAKWIDALYANVQNNPQDFVVERFRICAIEHSIEYVKQQTAAAYQGDFMLMNALSTAVQLERALLENKYFEVFEGDIASTRRTLALLGESTRGHYQKLHRFWRENGGG